jgi:porin
MSTTPRSAPHHNSRDLWHLTVLVSICCASMLCGAQAFADPANDIGEISVPSAEQSEEASAPPASLQRLFGETIPFPDPDSSGFELYALAMHDAYANTTGGAHRGGGVVGNLYVSMTVNTEKAGWFDNGKLVLEGIGVYGRMPSRVVGDYQYSSSIDAPDGIEPYQMYYEHTFFDDRLSLLAGIHDYSLDFAVLDYGWEFVHSGFWTPSTMTQMWWSFYPCTGLGSRAKLRLSESAYLLAGVYDGNPTQQDNNRKIDWGLSKRDGAHSLMELGFSESAEGKRPYKLAVGGWYNSGEFDAADGGVMHANSGSYLVGQVLLASEDESYTSGLGGFFQVGQADNTRNFNSWYFGAGLRYKGLFDWGPDDVLGLGWGRAQIGSTYQRNNLGTESYEGNAELTYRAVIQPWLTIQPSLQLITNPGANSDYDNSVIMYLRSEVLL